MLWFAGLVPLGVGTTCLGTLDPLIIDISCSVMQGTKMSITTGEVSGKFNASPPRGMTLPFVTSHPSHPIEGIFEMQHTHTVYLGEMQPTHFAYGAAEMILF